MTDWLDEIEARASAATYGPWVARDTNETKSTALPAYVDYQRVGTLHGLRVGMVDHARAVDMEFIINARSDVPTLIAEVRRLRTQVLDHRHRANDLDARIVRIRCGVLDAIQEPR